MFFFPSAKPRLSMFLLNKKRNFATDGRRNSKLGEEGGGRGGGKTMAGATRNKL